MDRVDFVALKSLPLKMGESKEFCLNQGCNLAILYCSFWIERKYLNKIPYYNDFAFWYQKKKTSFCYCENAMRANVHFAFDRLFLFLLVNLASTKKFPTAFKQ